VEIYRRLLTKVLAPFGTTNPQSNQVPHSQTDPSPALDRFSGIYGARISNRGDDPHSGIENYSVRVAGVYLPRVGIVFTGELPGQVTLPKARKSGTPETTEWDRTRRELRGEKVESSASGADRAQPNVLDAVLRSLADNGQHLSGLAADDSVVVALTFRGNWLQQCQKCHVSPAGTTLRSLTNSGQLYSNAVQLGGGPWQTRMDLSQGLMQGLQAGASREDVLPGMNPGGQSGKASSPSDEAMLGDLHFKQGRFSEAAAAYAKALAELSASDEQAWSMAANRGHAGSRPNILKCIELQNKIIQSEAAMNHEEQVNKGVLMLKRLTALLDRVEKGEGGKSVKETDKGKSKNPTLPEKLIITASKGLLDKVGKHQITFEDFKAQVRMEHLKFD
jgi:hypothetical protein